MSVLETPTRVSGRVIAETEMADGDFTADDGEKLGKVKKHVDLKQAMAILDDEFCIKRLAVVGGGKTNGGFLKAGLVDEISLLIGPGVAGRTGQPAVFDGLTSDRPTPLTLKSVKSYAIIIK